MLTVYSNYIQDYILGIYTIYIHTTYSIPLAMPFSSEQTETSTK